MYEDYRREMRSLELDRRQRLFGDPAPLMIGPEQTPYTPTLRRIDWLTAAMFVGAVLGAFVLGVWVRS